MKKAINSAGRSVLLPLLLLSLVFTASRGVTFAPDGRVKLLILSKQMRQMKDGVIHELSINPSTPGELQTPQGRFRTENLKILYRSGRYSVISGNFIAGEGKFILYPGMMNDTFSVIIDGEKRIYPLPLYIDNSRKVPELSVEENIDRYAIDSAHAEMGNVKQEETEALYALALLIKGRCHIPSVMNKHGGYDFCDLTCCQSYRGRTGREFHPAVSIKTESLKRGVFFHTSAGGRLFTEAVFNSNAAKYEAPKEIIYLENCPLSSEKYPHWTAMLSRDKISSILFGNSGLTAERINYNLTDETITVRTTAGDRLFPPETFRLMINRVKGWNFLKSNNYTVNESGTEFYFKGSGLGHGAGLSMEGALQLAGKGYSRYEIIGHYYPDTEYTTPPVNIPDPRLQYILFEYGSGKTILTSSPSFENRLVPCGSIFKLFVSLYLAERRRDIFSTHTWNCTNEASDKNLPPLCWNKTGHGIMDIQSALYNSCNKYFASLYKEIDRKDFLHWLKKFSTTNGIELIIPPVKDDQAFAELLAGLNFRSAVRISGLVRLNRYLFNRHGNTTGAETELIFTALRKTFTDGTAKMTEEEKKNFPVTIPAALNDKLWGKTGTVISGTNSHRSYGLFTGGTDSTGIVAILERGTGSLTAKESKKLLLEMFIKFSL